MKSARGLNRASYFLLSVKQIIVPSVFARLFHRTTGSSDGQIKVVIDGVTLFNSNLGIITIDTQRFGTLGFNHPFGTSLQIQQSTTDANKTVTTWVTYTTD